MRPVNLPNINTIFYPVGEKKELAKHEEKNSLAYYEVQEHIFVIFVIWAIAGESALHEISQYCWGQNPTI